MAEYRKIGKQMFISTPQATMAGLSDRGQVRQENQDWIRTDPDCGLFVLADGMGGVRGGAQASRIAGAYFHRYMRRWLRWEWVLPWRRAPLRTLRAMQQGLLAASMRVRQAAATDPLLEGMGTTLIGGLIRDRACLVVAVGDSRLYRLRNGVLEQITHDQTLAAKLLADGFVDTDDPRLARYAHVLTDVVGREEPPEVQRYHVRLQPGDRLLACSDGLSGALADRHLAGALDQQASLEHLARRLVTEAMDAGSKDNISVILIDPNIHRPRNLQWENPDRATVTPHQG